MYFLARSSRATGPKMRVPIGSPCGLTRTAEFWSKRREAAVGPADLLDGADDDRLVNVPLLHLAVGDRLLDADDDDVAHAGVPAPAAAEHLDAA